MKSKRLYDFSKVTFENHFYPTLFCHLCDVTLEGY